MTKYYEITRPPKGFSKLAAAAWFSLPDQRLYEVDGKLIFTDDIEECLKEDSEVLVIREEHDSFASFEASLLLGIAGWCTEDPAMIAEMEKYLKLNLPT